MCGILLNNYKTRDFKKALLSQFYRGPDNLKIVKSDNINMGFNYLSITGKKKNYCQPLLFKNLILLFNGEIYNFNSLNKEIRNKDNKFKSDSDTKTLINYFYHFGVKKTLMDIRGMWALCLVDKKNNNLYVSRDRLGIKPLFYYKKKNHLIISSSVRSIKLLIKNSKFNIRYLQRYLKSGSLDYSEETAYKDILNFPKSTYIKINLNKKLQKFKFVKFWNLKTPERCTLSNIDSLKKTIDNSIALHTTTQQRVKSLITLSGGLDSTYIQRKNLSNNFLSMSAHGQKFNQEVETISKFVSKYNLNHEHVLIKNEYFNSNNLKNFIYKMDQPIRSLHPYIQYIIRQKAKEKNVKVILTGDGADEIFGGYYYLIPYVKNYLSQNKAKNIQIYKKKFNKDFSKELNLYGKNINKNLFIKDILIKRLTKTHVPYWLRVEDEISMINSIENRVPYLDHKVVESALSFKSNLFYKDGLNKYFFRKVIKNNLPNFILNGKKYGKPGSSIIIVYEKLKKDILLILKSNNLKKFYKISSKKLLQKYLVDQKNKNEKKCDYWFRLFFLNHWIIKNNYNLKLKVYK